MKFNYLIKTAIIAGALLASFSCKKDDKDKTLPYLDGTVKITVPQYVLQGESIEVTPTGISHPDKKNFGYVVTLSEGSKEVKRDTVKPVDASETRVFNYVFPKEATGSYSLTATAFADGYSNSYNSKYINVVGPLTKVEIVYINGQPVGQLRKNPYASITGHGIDMTLGSYADINKTHRYYYTEATPGLYWMQNNLMEGKALAYAEEDAMGEIFGRYYNYEEAMTSCPEGWRLPTAAEWEALIEKTKASIAGNDKLTVPGAWTPDVKFNDVSMWSYWPSQDKGFGELTNSAQLSMIPAGYANTVSKHFDGIFEYAAFWSSDENPENDKEAKIYYIYNYENTVLSMYMDKESFGANVRCVKEK